MRLPVYELAPVETAPRALQSLAGELFGAEKSEIEEADGLLMAQEGELAVEHDESSGSIFAADSSRLRMPVEEAELVSGERAYEIADDLLKRNVLVPELDGKFSLDRIGPGATVMVTQTDGERRQSRLDVQARYQVTVSNPGVKGEPERLPLVGGGGKVSVTLAAQGRPVSLHRSWRQPVGEREVDALDRDEARERFDELTADLELTDVDATLAYHAAPSGTRQEVLAPTWVFGATIVANGNRVPMRLVQIPATEFGPPAPKLQPQPKRVPQPGSLVLAGELKEAGTSWIGPLGGLTGSQQNAKGFVDGLAADGWKINFNWGDANAWESDWERNDDTWVDAADFVFYTGHADQNGWLLVEPGTTNLVQLQPSVVGSEPQTPGDRWGQQDLEWVTVAACGPLQDEILARGGGDVLQRWGGAFDGLHTLMGYGAITFDTTEEGSKLAQYSRRGMPVIDAWLRTGQECQQSTNGESAPNGPNIWVGAMWVAKDGADPRFDHIWGHGAVSADPRSPTTLVCMWTTC